MTTSDLGPHFEDYLKRAVASGRYRDAADVIRDALRLHEDEERARLDDAQKLAALREDIAVAEAQVEAGLARYVTPEEILQRARTRRSQ